MPDQYEWWAAERVDRLVTRLMAGKRPDVKSHDAIERDAILAAARFAGAREGYPRMSPAFRRRMAALVETKPAPARLSRRGALVAGAAAAAGIAAGGVAERFAHLGVRVEAPQPVPLAGHPVTLEPDERVPSWSWMETRFKLADLIEGKPQPVTTGAIQAFLVRKGDQVTAVSQLCSHQPCVLYWKPDEQLLRCPCHNASFDLDGNSTKEYPQPALTRLNVKVEDGTVWVQAV
jgi:nitrite reductase/ring-hydroxylating ferredoxin subunit